MFTKFDINIFIGIYILNVMVTFQRKLLYNYKLIIVHLQWHRSGVGKKHEKYKTSRRRDRMVIGITTTYAISAYHH